MTSPIPTEGGKHTPGEWRAEREVDLNGFETGKLWIVMGGAPCAYDFDRYEDAVLAAAAPALLEALTDLVIYHDVPDECQDQVVKPLLKAAFAAIRQATGGEDVLR